VRGHVRVIAGVIHIVELFSPRALTVKNKTPESGQVFLIRKDEIART